MQLDINLKVKEVETMTMSQLENFMFKVSVAELPKEVKNTLFDAITRRELSLNTQNRTIEHSEVLNGEFEGLYND